MIDRLLDRVPFGLVLLRLCIVPTILLLAIFLGPDAGKIVVLLLVVAMLSDIFDGVIARKRGVATPALRQWDSNVDLTLGLGTLAAIWIMRSSLIAENIVPIGILVGLETLAYLVSFVRFRKGPANHAHLTRLWGFSLILSVSLIVGWGVTGIPFLVMVILGFVAYADNIAIIALLPQWQSDVPSAFHAARIRRAFAGDKG